MLHHADSGEFNIEDAVESLKEKYGVQATKEKNHTAITSAAGKKRKSAAPLYGDEETEDAVKDKAKVRKVDLVTVEANRSVSEAVKEMADICFKNKDMRKGG
jgi:hypothetical protein